MDEHGALEPKISRRDFLKLIGLGAEAILLAPLLARCAPRLIEGVRVEALSELTEKIKCATVCVDVTRMPEYAPTKMETHLGGTGIIFGETNKVGERNIVAFLTASHTLYTGYFIRELILSNPFAKYGRVIIDATAGAPNGRKVRSDEWSIRDIFDLEDGNVVLHLERPAGSVRLTSGTVYIDKGSPRKEEEYLALGCPYAKNRNPITSLVTYKKDGLDGLGNPCWHMYDPTIPFGKGASGGPVLRGEDLLGIIQGENNEKKLLYVTPAASALTYTTSARHFKSLAEWTQFRKETRAVV